MKITVSMGNFFACEDADICDDHESCTTDSCDAGAGGCHHVPLAEGTVCDDAEPCTIATRCAAGVCRGTEALACDDANLCTDDRAEDDGDGTCDDPASDCRHRNNTRPCSDGNACTTNDVCSAGACAVGPAPSCDDQRYCTDDSCSPATGCRPA